MNTIKKISDVIMLPTIDIDADICKYLSVGTLAFRSTDLDYHQNQYIYFTSDEEIENGDWYINLRNKPYLNRSGKTKFKGLYDDCKKVVASNNKSLGLPEPTDEWVMYYVGEYNKLNTIKKVLMTYKTDWDKETISLMEANGDNPDDFPYEIQPKLTEHKYINIIDIKNTYTREEYIAGILAFAEEFLTTKYDKACKSKIMKWINNNI